MQRLFDQLRERGCRITSARKIVYSAIPFSPVSVQEVAKSIATNDQGIDLVTIYRTLELFAELGLVRKIHLGEKNARYERVTADQHHHHVICQDCGEIQDVQIDEHVFLNAVRSQSDFKIKNHSLEFFGICKNCQRK